MTEFPSESLNQDLRLLTTIFSACLSNAGRAFAAFKVT